jgi:FtsP/CotA-like multicopper oxidase with cupredoxin domain
MTDFNLWTWNSRSFPASTPERALNDKVRIRIGNLTMTNHPIHCTATSSRSPAPMAARRPKARAGPR